MPIKVSPLISQWGLGAQTFCIEFCAYYIHMYVVAFISSVTHRVLSEISCEIYYEDWAFFAVEYTLKGL